MDNQKERLTAWLEEAAVEMDCPTMDQIADFLLAKGATAPPCKVGDTVYQTDGVKIYPSTIKKVIYDTGFIAFDETAIGKSIFLTTEGLKTDPPEPVCCEECAYSKMYDQEGDDIVVGCSHPEGLDFVHNYTHCEHGKLSYSAFKAAIGATTISEADLKAMYDAYIDDGATE